MDLRAHRSLRPASKVATPSSRRCSLTKYVTVIPVQSTKQASSAPHYLGYLRLITLGLGFTRPPLVLRRRGDVYVEVPSTAHSERNFGRVFSKPTWPSLRNSNCKKRRHNQWNGEVVWTHAALGKSCNQQGPTDL